MWTAQAMHSTRLMHSRYRLNATQAALSFNHRARATTRPSCTPAQSTRPHKTHPLFLAGELPGATVVAHVFRAARPSGHGGTGTTVATFAPALCAAGGFLVRIIALVTHTAAAVGS